MSTDWKILEGKTIWVCCSNCLLQVPAPVPLNWKICVMSTSDNTTMYKRFCSPECFVNYIIDHPDVHVIYEYIRIGK